MSLHSQSTSIFPSSISVANASVADIENISPFQNPANFSFAKSTQLLCLIDNKYLISELATKSALLIIPSKFGNFGVSTSHFGFSLYQEIIIAASYSRLFYEKFSLGLQFNYQTYLFSDANQHLSILYPQIGLTIPFENKLTCSFHVFNPFGSNFKSAILTKYVPTVFSLGCNFKFSSDLFWIFQIDKDLMSYYRIASGFEYKMMKRARFKLGMYANDFFIPCFGFGYDLNSFNIDLSTEIHPLLGVCPTAQLKIYLSEH
ncbi:hypothetical protein MASR2M117_18110 [Paludibacter sp.]